MGLLVLHVRLALRCHRQGRAKLCIQCLLELPPAYRASRVVRSHSEKLVVKCLLPFLDPPPLGRCTRMHERIPHPLAVLFAVCGAALLGAAAWLTGEKSGDASGEAMGPADERGAPQPPPSAAASSLAAHAVPAHNGGQNRGGGPPQPAAGSHNAGGGDGSRTVDDDSSSSGGGDSDSDTDSEEGPTAWPSIPSPSRINDAADRLFRQAFSGGDSSNDEDGAHGRGWRCGSLWQQISSQQGDAGGLQVLPSHRHHGGGPGGGEAPPGPCLDGRPRGGGPERGAGECRTGAPLLWFACASVPARDRGGLRSCMHLMLSSLLAAARPAAQPAPAAGPPASPRVPPGPLAPPCRAPLF